MNPIRISKKNEAWIKQIVRDSKNELLTPAKVVNMATEKGLLSVRNHFVKPTKK